VATLARLWFALPPESGREPSGTLADLSQRPLAALLHALDAASVQLARTLARGSDLRPLAVSEPLPEALDRLAAEHADCEFALVAPLQVLVPTLARALDLAPAEAVRLQPRPGSLSAFHWPTGSDPLARPELVGLDLDWLPPWHPGQPRPRFPGGPGVAGSPRR
jgi:hypothetical protein